MSAPSISTLAQVPRIRKWTNSLDLAALQAGLFSGKDDKEEEMNGREISEMIPLLLL